jgi:type IV secretory pathway TraG/TraD family ATPase VirD4
LPALTNFLAQGRKYGGCGMIGFQNYPQLVALYGREGSEAIADLCATWVIFRCNSKSGAKWASDNIGNIESIETSEGISYGINEIRDGINVNKTKKERVLVTATELMNLPNLAGYIRLGRGYPIARFITQYEVMPVKATSFVERESAQAYVVGSFNACAQTLKTDADTSKSKQCDEKMNNKNPSLDKVIYGDFEL